MSKFTQKEIVRLAPGEHGIAQFALQVVSMMVGDGAHLDRPPRDDVLGLLVRGAMTGDPKILASLSSEFRRLRIPAEAAVDIYVPAAVRQIGAAWHEDELDVLEATVAVSRLQNLVRELGRAWRADSQADHGDGSILMIVPEGEQHTLGAMIATTQLRRVGVSVAVQFAPSWSAIEDKIAARHFDAVFMSIGNHDSLEIGANIVRTMERRMKERLPVVVGGSIPLDMDVVRRTVRADFASQDVRAALDFLGLRGFRHAAQ